MANSRERAYRGADGKWRAKVSEHDIRGPFSSREEARQQLRVEDRRAKEADARRLQESPVTYST